MHFGEFANYTEYFAQAILNNTVNAPDLEEGIDSFCVMEAIRCSVTERQPVSVDAIRTEVGLSIA